MTHIMNFLRSIRSVANDENIRTVVNYCSQVAAAVSSQSSKVEVLSPSKLNALMKCDDSMTFSIYSERCRNPTYFVIYVPRLLAVFCSLSRAEAERICASFICLKTLIHALESGASNSLTSEIELLRNSITHNDGFRDIHHASACGFTEAICRMCSLGDSEVILNEASADGRLPLHIAAENNRQDTLRTLLRLGADITKQDSKLRNVVHYAAGNSPDTLAILKSSPQFGRAIDAIDENGMSPLCMAVLGAQLQSAKILLDAGCSTGPFPAGPLAAIITFAAYSTELDGLIDLISQYSPNFLFERIDGTSTILHEKLNSKLLYHILNGTRPKLDVNVRDGQMQTPLHCAARRGDLEQAIALLAFEADVNAADADGNTALHHAVQQGSLCLVKLLLCFNADVKALNSRGLSPNDIARTSSHKEKKEILECIQVFATAQENLIASPENVLSDFMQRKAFKRIEELSPGKRKNLTNVLSLDGGGIKGLVLVQILLHIEEALGCPIMEHFSWLAGTSTGALLALSLARGDSLHLCRRLYLSFKDEIFMGNRPYSESAIERFLQLHFGNECTLAHIEAKRVMVTAASIKTNPPQLRLFRNYCLPIHELNEPLGYSDPKNERIWYSARCSSAAPTFFPPKGNLVDGGLMSNNPTLDLLTDIHTYNSACSKLGQEEVQLGCILSIGTGRSPAETINSAKFSFGTPQSIADGISMIRDMISLKNILIEQITFSDGECVKRARSWAHDQRVPFFRFSPKLSSHVELDEVKNEAIVNFLWDTEKYLRTDGRPYVLSLVNYLKTYRA